MNKNLLRHIMWVCACLLIIASCAENFQPMKNESSAKFISGDSQSRALVNPPPANILSPISEQVIRVGDSVFFAADPGDSTMPLTYIWDFDGAAANTYLRTPGSIQFLKSGSFEVSLTTFDNIGTQSLKSTIVSLIVIADPEVNQAPTGIIKTPSVNKVVTVGDSVNFSAMVSDPENNVPMTFAWDFDGVSTSSNVLNPGMVNFNVVGVYKITFTVTDALGQIDTNPSSYFITVKDLSINNADFPNGTITAPATDMTIATGDPVIFEGLGESLAGNVPLTYLWTFNGVAPDSMMDLPGPVIFDMPGVYNVTFTVTDSLGQVDSTPAEVIIVVEDAVSPPAPVNPAPVMDAPAGEITKPAGDVTIMAGESVDFMGMGTSPVGNDPVTYAWTFDGVAPDSMEQNPGMIAFDMVGTYEVELVVIDSMGVEDPMPPIVLVTVETAAVTPPTSPPVTPAPAVDTPAGEITKPTEDVTIMAGESVDFMGMGTSPVGNDPVTYAWSFDGAAPDSMEQNPGMIAFDMVGTYEVELVVIDSMGFEDPMPPIVVVTVETATGAPPVTPPVDAPPVTDAPVAEITMPAMDVTVVVGETLEFAATAMSPVGNDPLTYLWDFAGGAPESMDLNPGMVTFNMEGIYDVTFMVTDSSGVMNDMHASIIVTVEPASVVPPTDPTVPPVDPAAPPVVMPPSGEIDSPSMDITIAAGDSVMFIGEGDSPSNSPLTYLWTFAGGAPDSDMAELGAVTFEEEGEYSVTFTVTDKEGVSDPAPPTVMVTVTP